MDALLHREKYKEERRVRQEVERVLASKDPSELGQRARELAARVSETSKNKLVHYIALRKQVLELFKRSMELTPGGVFPSESTVHSVTRRMGAAYRGLPQNAGATEVRNDSEAGSRKPEEAPYLG